MSARRLAKEIKDFAADPPPGCTGGPVGDDIYTWNASFPGPGDTPYAGGEFHLSIKFPPEYPLRPPHVTFKTRVYHPNIKDDGGVCLDILKDAWTPALTVGKVLISLQLLLSEPNPETPLVPDIAEQFKTDRAAYNAMAKEWTEKYALPTAVAAAAPPA